MSPEQFDRQKFKAAVLYVLSNGAGRAFGKLKLSRTLFIADMVHFLQHARPLTGALYQRQQVGPVAKYLPGALLELKREGLLEVRREFAFGVPSLRLKALEFGDRDSLRAEERALLDESTAFVGLGESYALSELNDEAAWSSAELGETIPYFAAYLIVPCEVTDADVAWGTREAETLSAAA